MQPTGDLSLGRTGVSAKSARLPAVTPHIWVWGAFFRQSPYIHLKKPQQPTFLIRIKRDAISCDSSGNDSLIQAL
jgi:hypothetical protein